MGKLHRYYQIVIIFTIVLFSNAQQYDFPPARRYPSSLVQIAIPGAWENPTDPQTVLEFVQMYGTATAEMVKRWEIENTDLIVGANYGPDINQKKIVLGYEYFHTIREPFDQLRKRAII
ncbi:MAG: hypothetical protein NZ822_02890 [Patescibacteria group bacterium]|nr:hypothetical protein [Patescibacteria group bacterium]